MGLLDIFKDKTEKTPLEEIKNTFRFLISDYGFQLVEVSNRRDFKAEHFLVYRNDNSNVQLEICADESWFHCEIRRLVNGQPARYSDEDHCIGFESLAILESNNNYEHLDYFAGGSTRLEGVLRNTAKLLKRHKTFLTNGEWIDVKRIHQLRNHSSQTERDESLSKLANELINNKVFWEALKKQALEFFRENGYAPLADSDELSPFDKEGMVHFLTFEKANKQIKISQVDWRDIFYKYRIEVDQKKVFEIDISNQDIEKVVAVILEELNQHL